MSRFIQQIMLSPLSWLATLIEATTSLLGNSTTGKLLRTLTQHIVSVCLPQSFPSTSLLQSEKHTMKIISLV